MEIKQLKKLNEKVLFSKESNTSIFQIRIIMNQKISDFIFRENINTLYGTASITPFCQNFTIKILA